MIQQIHSKAQEKLRSHSIFKPMRLHFSSKRCNKAMYKCTNHNASKQLYQPNALFILSDKAEDEFWTKGKKNEGMAIHESGM